MRKFRLFCVASAVVIGMSMLPMTSFAAAGEKFSVGNGRNQHIGNSEGYSYEIWLDQTGGSGSMTLGSGGTFDTEWSAQVSAGNFLARRGQTYDRTTKADQMGDIVLDYAAQYSAQGGNSRLCVYGWFTDPLVEYYIIEDWKNWRPTGNSKTITVDGAEYEIFTVQHTGPTILGDTRTFPQYFSVRKQTRNSGTITVSDHFKAWGQNGMQIGNLTEVALNVEGWESSGRANVTKLTITDKKVSTTPTQPPEPVEPDANGYYFNEGFESGAGDFEGRAGASVATNTSAYAEGKSSLKITDRSQDYTGATIPLDSNAFIAGKSYSFNAAVMQDQESSTSFKMSLQYNLNGEENYDEIATATGTSGKWTTIGNTSYTIPSGATNLMLYIETPSSTTDFYVDSVSGAVSGTKCNIDLSGAKPQGGTVVTGTTSSNQGTTPTVTAGSGVAAHQNNDYTYTKGGSGFKDVMGPYFRLGTCLNAMNANNQQVQNFIKENFNSITCENEMKPDSICKQNLSNLANDEIGVDLSGAESIFRFCEQNNIALRGHTFVWYSQTPEWIFKDGNNYVSKERMNKRLESMIKNTFAWLKKNHPNLKIYAYDVCNELFKNDGGGFRGDGGEYSNWWTVYKSDEFVINAFKYARQYAPADCKLYLNDYNEYFTSKCDDLYNMAKKVLEAGPYIDGIGMQSHMHAADFGKSGSAHKNTASGWNTYADTIDKFSSLGLDVQITELDVTNCADPAGASLFVDIFRAAMERHEYISSFTLWGHCDSASWRNSYEDGGKPLPFDSNCQPKAFYNDILALAKEIPSETTTTTTTPTTTTTTTTSKTTTTTTTTAPKASKLGDVNESGTVDVSDAVLLARFVAEDSAAKISATGKLNADTNKNGNPDSQDMVLILQYIAKMISSF